MAEVVDPVLVNPGSRVMTPIVVSSLEISIPDEPSVAGMTLSSSCLSPYVSDAVAGASTVASTGGAKVTAPVCSATLAGATLAVATAASAVWVTSGIRVFASRSCRTTRPRPAGGLRERAQVDAVSSHEVTGLGNLSDPREVVQQRLKARRPRAARVERAGVTAQ